METEPSADDGPDPTFELQRKHARERVRGRLFGASAEAPLRLGSFRLGEKLGEGAMGSVYRAYDEKLEREVAIKVLRSSSGDSADLLREARAMGRIAHPHVAAVHEVGEEAGVVYVAMELVEGRTLRDWLATRPALDMRLACLLEAGRGLAAAHERGLIHRDFKPENVLVGEDGRSRVVDFGLAAITRAAGDDGRGQPVAPFSPGRAGTPAYMSPEQLRGDFADSRSDQFNFCATAFEVLYGSAPHAGLSLPERLEVIEAGRVAPVDRRHPAIHLHPILVRGLAADPERRYPTMAALLDDLERAERRRRRRGAIPVTVLALAALLGLVAWLTRRPASQVTVQIVDGLDLTLYSEISSLVQEGRFRECIAATERHPPTAGVLAMRIECARAIGDTPVLEQGCAELAQRYPDYERPAACNEALSIARDLRERGQARQCVELVQAQPAPSLLLVVEMYRCAGDLRDRDVYVSACRFAAKHFPDHYRLQDCPKPLP